jgi:hypothetical protein
MYIRIHMILYSTGATLACRWPRHATPFRPPRSMWFLRRRGPQRSNLRVVFFDHAGAAAERLVHASGRGLMSVVGDEKKGDEGDYCAAG